MNIRQKQLWWLIPIFVGLFLFGMLLAKISEKPLPPDSSVHKAVVIQAKQEAYRDEIGKLIDQLSAKRPIAYQIQTQNQWYKGFYSGETFDITGNVSGHTIQMKRTDQKLSVKVDGEEETPQFLPYALFTPYEHAMVIQAQLQSISPLQLDSRTRNGLKGYQFTLPPDQVHALLSLWLGPQFQGDDVIHDLLQHVVIRYELWYDTNDQRVKQLNVDLEVKHPQNPKHDQLVFRFV